MHTVSVRQRVALPLFAALVGGVVGYFWGGQRPTANIAPISDPATLVAPVDRETQVSRRDTFRPDNQTKSDYRLTLDFPQNVRRLSERDARLLQWFQNNNEADYERLFSSYGLDEGERRSLMAHITKIYQAKIEASKHTSQLMMAQSEFDERMKRLLGDKYPDYVAYEKRKPIREESGFLAEHLQNSGAGLSDSQRQALEKLLEQNEAFSSRTKGSLGGPRGDVPAQAYGAEALAALERDQAALSLRSASLLREATAAGLSANQITALRKYYDMELERYDQILTASNYPTAKDIALVEQRIQSLKTRGDNTGELGKLEAQLKWMRKSEKVRPTSP